MSEQDKRASMQTYVRRPETVRAVQWHKPGDHPDAKLIEAGDDYDYVSLDARMVNIGHGDWIVYESGHGFDVVRDDDFRRRYQPAPAAPPQGAAEGDVDDEDPYDIADALGVLGRRVEGAKDEAIVDVTTSDRSGEGTLSARELRDVVAAASEASRLRALLAAAEPHGRGPSREWLERAGEIEDQCRSVSVGGLAVDAGMYGVAASLVQEARDRAAAARPQVGEATRKVLETLWRMVERDAMDLSLRPLAVASWSDETHDAKTEARIAGDDVLAALRECGIEVPR